MATLDGLVRLTKLGLFVSWGVAVAMLSACRSATAGPDAGSARDRARADQARSAGHPDVARVDAGRADRSLAPDTAKRALKRRAPPRKRRTGRPGWDVPLE